VVNPTVTAAAVTDMSLTGSSLRKRAPLWPPRATKRGAGSVRPAALDGQNVTQLLLSGSPSESASPSITEDHRDAHIEISNLAATATPTSYSTSMDGGPQEPLRLPCRHYNGGRILRDAPAA